MNVRTAAAKQHRQVLDLCIGCIYDTKTLLCVSLADREAHGHVTEHVQQQLPSLVRKAVTTGLEDMRLTLEGNLLEDFDTDYEDAVEQPLQWLLRAAGTAAVNTAAVAAVLLNVLQLIPEKGDLQRYMCDAAIESGFQLDMQQLVEASKQRVKGLDKWIHAAGRAGASYSIKGQLEVLQQVFLVGTLLITCVSAMAK
jgi:hypothetical protein